MRQILDPQFVSSEYRRSPPWMATIASDATLEEILDPVYWSHVAAKLHMLDRIECWWENGTRYVELLVVKTSGTQTRCRVLNDVDLRDNGHAIDLAKELEAFEINYGGPSVGHRVIRKSDLAVIRSDQRWTEDDARRWLLDHLSQPTNRRIAMPPAQPSRTAAATAARLAKNAARKAAERDAITSGETS